MKAINNYKCPMCGADMEKKHGRYGWFWGCRAFKNTGCRGSVDIPVKDFEFECIDFDYFISNNPTAYLLSFIENNDVPGYIKDLKNVLDHKCIEKGTVYRRDVEGKISGLFDYLRKNDRTFEIARLAYWFYNLDGDLQGKIDYWLNRKPKNDHRKEYHVKKAFINNWDLSIFNLLGQDFYEEEFVFGERKGDFGGYKVDIVCKDRFTEKLIFIEVKGPSQKGITAKMQVIEYVRYYNRLYPNNIINKAYIICKGYPRNVLDDLYIDGIKLGVIGYVIEGDKITFIPWEVAL